MSMDTTYIVITWPEIQELQDVNGFNENAYLINDEQGLTDFGSSAYFVNKEWYNKIINSMDTDKLYLLTTLIEYSDSVSDGHSLYSTLAKAKEAMAQEIAECQENFSGHGELIIDLPRCKEWRNADGLGYTVTIEEVVPQ